MERINSMIINEKYTESIDALKNAMDALMKLNYPFSKIRAIYAELYIANELIEFEPKIGMDRGEFTSADIYMKKVDKSVEVKACEQGIMTFKAKWTWTFQQKQISEKKFDFVCLIGFCKESYIVDKVFILKYEEIEGLRIRKDPVRKDGSLYIDFYDNLDIYREDITNGGIEIEDKLVHNPSEFELKNRLKGLFHSP